MFWTTELAPDHQLSGGREHMPYTNPNTLIGRWRPNDHHKSRIQKWHSLSTPPLVDSAGSLVEGGRARAVGGDHGRVHHIETLRELWQGPRLVINQRSACFGEGEYVWVKLAKSWKEEINGRGTGIW